MDWEESVTYWSSLILKWKPCIYLKELRTTVKKKIVMLRYEPGTKQLQIWNVKFLRLIKHHLMEMYEET
jgi:hypothetical protein